MPRSRQTDTSPAHVIRPKHSNPYQRPGLNLTLQDIVQHWPLHNYNATNPTLSYNLWVIDRAQGQDGWMLAKFFFWMFIAQDRVKVHKLKKKETKQNQNEANTQLSHHDWTSLVSTFWWNFSYGTKQVVPSSQDIWVTDQAWGQYGWILAKFFNSVQSRHP